MNERMTERVASVAPIRLEGTFHRHASLNRDAFAGSPGGRWGTENFAVIYLGRPPHGVVVEAYRHLVDSTPGMRGELVRSRVFYTVSVEVERILDLTNPDSLAAVGLEAGDLLTDPYDYEPCQAVASAAHQLGYKGVLAPAANGFGQTLALFSARLDNSERPTIVSQEVWQHLPADPRQLKLTGRASSE